MLPLTSPAPCSAPSAYLAPIPTAAASATGAPTAAPRAITPRPATTGSPDEPIPCVAVSIGAAAIFLPAVAISCPMLPDLAAALVASDWRLSSAWRSGVIFDPSHFCSSSSDSAGATSAPKPCSMDLPDPTKLCNPVRATSDSEVGAASTGAAFNSGADAHAGVSAETSGASLQLIMAFSEVCYRAR